MLLLPAVFFFMKSMPREIRFEPMSNAQLRELNDYELLYMMRQKNEDAYQLMLDKYTPAVIHVIFRKIDAKYRNYIFEDAFQEAMTMLFSSMDSYREDSGVKFFSFGVLCVERKLLDIIKRMSRGTYLSWSEFSLDAPLEPNSSSRYEDIVEDRHYEYRPEEYSRAVFLQEELLLAVDKLDEEERKVYLYQCLGYNYTQIAELEEINSKKVDYLLRKARKKLKIEMNRREND